MITYVLFIIWFIILIKWADFLVQWSASLAKKFKISELVIGLTIVAIWTSTPELIVNIISGIKWSWGIAIGNILWSNIANILLVLWLAACIYPLTIKKSIIYREIPFSLAAIIILRVIIDNFIQWPGNTLLISRLEGIFLLGLFWIFLFYIFRTSRHNKEEIVEEVEEEIHTFSSKKSLIYISLWLAWLIIWWEWIVNGAVVIAEQMWLSELTIGLTVIAIGTSLPELATSAMAARKGKSDIAIGNVVWSNILNIFRVLGATATIHPITVPDWINRDIRFAIFATVILLIFAITKRWFTLHRYQGFLMIIAYIIYIWIVLLNIKQ